VRNYGFLVNNIGNIGTKAAPVTDPFAAGVVQVAPLDPSLASVTDLYFRGYDQNQDEGEGVAERLSWARFRAILRIVHLNVTPDLHRYHVHGVGFGWVTEQGDL
jgi:hypothetical protein